jgi:hypothetical protein
MSLPELLRALVPVVLLAACSGDAGKMATTGGSNGSEDGLAEAGADDGGRICNTVSRCGGDLVGSWMVTDACLTLTRDLNSACTGASAVTSVTMFTGTAAYTADLTYSRTSVSGATTHYIYPWVCLNGATCRQFGNTLMQVGMYDSVTCMTLDSGGCSCDASVLAASSTVTGTYTISDGVLATTHDGVTDTVDYCVDGGLMQQLPTVTDGIIAGSITLVKQESEAD